jgi:hypothetical protein
MERDLMVKGFAVGDRVATHPASDLFMRGMRFGTIAKIGTKWIHVDYDTWPHDSVKVAPKDLVVIP